MKILLIITSYSSIGLVVCSGYKSIYKSKINILETILGKKQMSAFYPNVPQQITLPYCSVSYSIYEIKSQK
jgi:hypothetical protein